MADRTRFEEALASLPQTHPLAVRFEEAKCGLHVINQALAHQNMHIEFLKSKIIEEYDRNNHQRGDASRLIDGHGVH